MEGGLDRSLGCQLVDLEIHEIMTEMHGYSLNGLISSFHPNNYNFFPVSDQSNLLILLIYTPWQWIMQKAIKYYHIPNRMSQIKLWLLSTSIWFKLPLSFPWFTEACQGVLPNKMKKIYLRGFTSKTKEWFKWVWDLQCLSNKEYAPLRCRRAWGYWKYMWCLAINLVWSLHTKLIAHMLGYLGKQ